MTETITEYDVLLVDTRDNTAMQVATYQVKYYRSRKHCADAARQYGKTRVKKSRSKEYLRVVLRPVCVKMKTDV